MLLYCRSLAVPILFAVFLVLFSRRFALFADNFCLLLFAINRLKASRACVITLSCLHRFLDCD